MMTSQSEQITDKIQKLSKVLGAELARLSPCSEYELLKRLQQYPQLAFLKQELADSHTLFQNHFLLFHVLYRLREKYWQQQLAHLEISPLNIIYQPFQSGQQGLGQADSLRDYYLDLSQLTGTTSNDVDELMGRFWVNMHCNEHRSDALAVLGLSDPVDDKAIKKTYQKLVMQHHPDRGGDELKIQELNLAMEVLKQK